MPQRKRLGPASRTRLCIGSNKSNTHCLSYCRTYEAHILRWRAGARTSMPDKCSRDFLIGAPAGPRKGHSKQEQGGTTSNQGHALPLACATASCSCSHRSRSACERLTVHWRSVLLTCVRNPTLKDNVAPNFLPTCFDDGPTMEHTPKSGAMLGPLLP